MPSKNKKLARPLSECLESVDTPEGKDRVRKYLETQPYPHYEPAKEAPGLLVRIEADGKRTVGKFVDRKFRPSHGDVAETLRRNPEKVKAFLRKAVRSGDEKRIAEAVKIVQDSGFPKWVMGARHRDLTARHLLIYQEELPKASPEDRQAFEDYVRTEKWRSLYQHDRSMYLLLRRKAKEFLG